MITGEILPQPFVEFAFRRCFKFQLDLGMKPKGEFLHFTCIFTILPAALKNTRQIIVYLVIALVVTTIYLAYTKSDNTRNPFINYEYHS